ncbi:hypothetical protein GE061_017727, partial [Apolygus lucorum]
TVDEWDTLVPAIPLLFRRILSCMVFNSSFLSSDNDVEVIYKVTDAFMCMVDKTPKLKHFMMELNGVKILQLVIWEDLRFVVRKRILFRFKKLLKTLPGPQRKDLIGQSHFLQSSFVVMLPFCGDYEFQEYLTELLVRLALSRLDWKNLLKSWFSEFPSIVTAVDFLDTKNYEVSCRKFLNAVNESQPSDGRVHSLPCLHAVVSGSIELLKPDGYDELWLDCSPREGDMDLLVDGGAGSWARVTVEFSHVRSIKCSHISWRNGPEEIDCCQLLIEVQPPVSIPLETQISFSELVVVLKKDFRFQELENCFLKTIYAYYYEPERARSFSSSFVGTRRAPTSLLTTSSSRKTSLANVTLSSIEKDRSNATLGSSTSASKLPRFAATFARKHITASTPLKNKDGGKIDAKRQVLKKNEKIFKPEIRSEDGPVSMPIRQRTSVSDTVTLTACRDLKTDSEPFKEITSNFLLSPMETFENPVNHSLESNELCLPSDSQKLMEEVTRHNILSSNGHDSIVVVSENGLESMTTNERTTPHEEPTHYSSIQPIPTSQIVDLITAEGSRVSNSTLDHGGFLVPGIPPSQEVFGAKHSSLVDFKALNAPQPESKGTSPELSPKCLPFKKKFFGKFRKPLADLTESEASYSSCSTRISKRNFDGSVQIRSPNFNPDLKHNGGRKIVEDPTDPFNFVDDTTGNNHEHVDNTKPEFREPTMIKRNRRKLYTPGEDEALHSNERDSLVIPFHQQSIWNSRAKDLELSSPYRRPIQGKSILDSSQDGSKHKKKVRKSRSKKNVNEGNCKEYLSDIVNAKENDVRRNLRSRKRVNYKMESESDCEMNSRQPKSAKQPRTFRSRKVEPLRSEVVAMSPPMPSCSSPCLPPNDIDHTALSPPCIPVNVPEPESLQVSPQSLDDVNIHPVKMKISKKRQVKRSKGNVDGNKKKSRGKPLLPSSGSASSTQFSDVIQCDAVEPDNFRTPFPAPIYPTAPTETKETLPDERIMINPGEMNRQPVGSNVLCVDLPSEANRQCEEKATLCVQQEYSMDTSMSIPIRTISQQKDMHGLMDQIWSQVKMYVNGVKRDETTIVESVEVNLRTCLDTHKTVMKVIEEEMMNIARSAANVQSAYEKAVANFDVVNDMMKAIESIHRESSIAASVRNKDPRSFSQLRQQIYKLVNESLFQKSLEK